METLPVQRVPRPQKPVGRSRRFALRKQQGRLPDHGSGSRPQPLTTVRARQVAPYQNESLALNCSLRGEFAMEEKIPKLAESIPTPGAAKWTALLTLNASAWNCQPDFLADREFAAHAHVQIGIVRSKQSERGRARNVARRVIRRVHEGRLVEVGACWRHSRRRCRSCHSATRFPRSPWCSSDSRRRR